MKRRVLLFVAATLLAIGVTTGVEIVDSASKLCTAPAKVSFADDVL